MPGAFARALVALNLRQEKVSSDGQQMEITFRQAPTLFWGTVQLLWGFALIHYIFYGWFVVGVADVFREFFMSSTPAKALMAVTIILYLPSFFDGSEKKLGRPWAALRTHPIWGLSQSYFPARLKRTVQLNPSKKYVFGWHPHGILILSRIHVYGGVWEKLFPGIPFRVLGASPMFFVPGCREICLWFGAVDAGRKTAENVLRNNMSVAVYPGGSREIFSTDPNSSITTVVLNKRKGFVKLAVKESAELVPVFVFGEKKCYKRLNVPVKIRDWLLKNLKIPLIIFWGRFLTWYPFMAEQTVVFGEPIETGNVDVNSEDEINQLHAKYVDAVIKLFETHKKDAGYGEEEKLVVV